LKKYNVPYELIKSCVYGNRLDTLVYFLRLRSAYRNRIIFKFTYAKAAKLMSCSNGSAHKHIKRMQELGWIIKQECGNVHCAGTDRIKSIYKNQNIIQIPVAAIKRDQVMQLEFALVRNNIDKQGKAISKKTKTVLKAKKGIPMSKADYKSMQKLGGQDKFEKSLQSRTTLSNRKFGQLCNRSTVTGQRRHRAYWKAGLIKSDQFFDLIGKADGRTISEIRKYNDCFYLKLIMGMVVKQRSNTVSVAGRNNSNPKLMLYVKK
jgi:Mn-dependent DtxR family transcriptional regulator